MRTDVLQPRDLIYPDWPAAPRVKAFFTTRACGVSANPYASLNLGAHVGDEPHLVAENRRRVSALLPSVPVWLNQVHGVNVVAAEVARGSNHAATAADGSVTAEKHVVCAVLVADCLPVLFCMDDGSRVGAAHAGWRGLHRGVLERSIEALGSNPAKLLAWLGPAIGANAFEVGADVFDAFTKEAGDDASAFRAIPEKRDKYFADIYALARQRLRRAGVTRIFGGKFCTVREEGRFFSYRRDGQTGRMAALIWLQ